MFIKALEYSEYPGDPKSWKVTGLDFSSINLIVGRNASGKSRVVAALHRLTQIISGKLPAKFTSGKWEVIFERMKGKVLEEQIYRLEIVGGKVVTEAMSIAGKLVMARDESGKGFVLRKAGLDRVIYKVPNDQLMSVVRRDEIQHPYFEQMYHWANSVCFYKFGSDFGRSTLSGMLPYSEGLESQISEMAESVSHVFQITYERFGEEFKEMLLRDFDLLGYSCDDVVAAPVNTVHSLGSIVYALAVKEKGFDFLTTQSEMSQGMYRALAILIQFNANILWTQSKMVGRTPQHGDSPMIIIDDIGEGLDFQRSKTLISLLVEKAQAFFVQLIMTSNDRFVMNDVPLNYWVVLERTEGKVRAYSFENSKNAFEEFEFMGLSNFDFFSGKYFRMESE